MTHPALQPVTERDKEQRLYELSELGAWIAENPNVTRQQIAMWILQRVTELCQDV